MLYRYRGGRKPIGDGPSTALAKAIADKQIRAFKRTFRGVVTRAVESEEEASLFKPSTSTNNAIAGVGISGRHPI